MVTAAIAHPTSATRLWFGLLAGPLAWTIDELAAIALAYDHCASGLNVSGWLASMSLIGIVALAVTSVAIVSNWRLISGRVIDSGLGEVTDDRVRFMARFGLVVSALSLFAIFLRAITALFLGSAPC
jgi:hypothetical protein